MPKILARDPVWLSRLTPGFNLFQPDSQPKSQSFPDVRCEGALRTIAHRGTEVFVAVGKELRWSDVALLKDAGEEYEKKFGRSRWSDGQQDEREGERAYRAYRLLKTPVSRPITQLSISPSGDYLAILTTHTCHVAILPSSTSHLRPQEPFPLRLKTFQLGPTAHVLEQSPLVTAIWHPLSPTNSCLITLTKDACARQWELDTSNRSTFDEPALAIDLKKLANATTSHADFSASKYGTNKGFSPDDVEMQVAGACFGGAGQDYEHGWASMTLWVAMTEGDVYALCPFLPSKWVATGSLLGSLSTSVLERSRALRGVAHASEHERMVVDQQCKWLADVDSEDPLLMPGATDRETVEVYSRPAERLGPVPKLQGPFAVVAADELDFGEVTDIFVVAPKVDDAALYQGEEDDEDGAADALARAAEEGLSVSIVCLATSSNKVHVCLDVNGVEAEWLPTKRSQAYTFDDDDGDDEGDDKELVLFETLDLSPHSHTHSQEEEGHVTFTPSPAKRYELFITSPTGIYGLSFTPWISMLEDELAGPSDSGVDFRIDVLLDSARTLVDRPVEIAAAAEERGISAAVAILDPSSVGFVVLTAAQDNTNNTNIPYATILDTDSSQTSQAYTYAPDSAFPATLPTPSPRAPYRPASEFTRPSALPLLIKTAKEKRLLGPTGDLKSQVRFSPATLQLLTEAHRVMSAETHRLGLAAAELFRQCERMRWEMREQVRRVAEIGGRVGGVVGEEDYDGSFDGGEGDGEGERALVGKERIEVRAERVRKKGEELGERVEALRRKVRGIGGPGAGGERELRERERAFGVEVERLGRSVLASNSALAPADEDTPAEEDSEGVPQRQRPTSSTEAPSDPASLSNRFHAVQSLSGELIKQVDATVERGGDVKEGSKPGTANSNANWKGSGVSVGADFRKQKLAQVLQMLERETMLVERVGERLGRLRMGA